MRCPDVTQLTVPTSVSKSGKPATDPKIITISSSLFTRFSRMSLTVFLPIIAVLFAPFYHHYRHVRQCDIALFFIFWFLTMIGIAVGFHRHFTHHSFKTTRWLTAILGILGSMAGQGPVSFWVSVHRRHHEHSDEDGDPHSPKCNSNTFVGRLRGIAHAHLGWLFGPTIPNPTHYAKDVLRDPLLRKLNTWYFPIFIIGLLLPALVGGAIGGTIFDAFSGFLWGGLLRLFVVSNLIWAVNSIGHLYGSEPFSTGEHSRNLSVLAIPTLGESWHNNHHAQPTAAILSFSPWQLDPSGALIVLFERCGMVWDVKRFHSRLVKE